MICATGYARAREPLVGQQPAAQGLRFIGYVSRPGGLGYMAKEAKRAAKAIAGELAVTPAGRRRPACQLADKST